MEAEGDRGIDWEVFAATAWSIWNNRNLVKHDGRCKLAKAIAKEVSNYAEEFRQGSAPLLHRSDKTLRIGHGGALQASVGSR